MAFPQLLGIVNITNDSFSDGGRFLDQHAAISHADNLLETGADVIDLGAVARAMDTGDSHVGSTHLGRIGSAGNGRNGA